MSFPKVIFGTSGLGNLYVAMPDDVKCAIVEAYIKASNGSPFFDTAGKYGAGLALESIAKCLMQLNVAPHQVLISNKLGWLRVPLTAKEPTFEPGVWKDLKFDAVQKISYDGILECYEQGNELLQSYHANYVSVHDPDEYLAAATHGADENERYHDILQAYAALGDLKRSGKVTAIGVGAKDWTVIARIAEDVQLDWVMIANSMTVHSHPKALLDFMNKLKQRGTVIINSAVFNAGFLTGGEYYNYKKIEPDTPLGQQFLSWREGFYSVCASFNISPAAVGVKFGLLAPGVKSVALSTTNPGRVAANMELVDAVIHEKLWHELYNRQLITADGLSMVLNGTNEIVN
ncbi:aldo/keto reductase [Mucilaginibacter sp.]|uniref:aldo/keto reductase n=1 Tax=Mucilaginibacter sp. TaxID=1882438 RepID=UPI003267E4A2